MAVVVVQAFRIASVVKLGQVLVVDVIPAAVMPKLYRFALRKRVSKSNRRIPEPAGNVPAFRIKPLLNARVMSCKN